MPKNRRHQNQQNNQPKRLRFKIFILILAILASAIPFHHQTRAASCPDLKIIFARGSGGERYTSNHYLAFKTALETKLTAASLSYEFDDLDYPAISVGVDDGHIGTLLGAYFGSGEAYEFGDSVRDGVDSLIKAVESGCEKTKYVIAGYSQGALVVANALDKISPNKLIFAATFGDPKIYLPEGKGLLPAACRGGNLSEYRIYVPDCRAYKGIMGAKEPYVTDAYSGKVGTWCNKFDVMCSSYFSITNHISYEEDGLYEDASRYIFSKIGAEFNIKNQYTSPHDTAILIDSTASMGDLFGHYEAEALKLAQKTFDAGGRVALYDYRDLNENYIPVERCNFDTCNPETFQQGLNAIEIYGGGDDPESLLSASLHVMKQLEWKLGSTKSLVILTDAGYHSPDLDGTTFYDVQKLSKQIDPVNFYIVTPNKEAYQTLADVTGGAAVSSADDLSILTDTIMERYDSLPRVEEEFEDENYDHNLPEITIVSTEKLTNNAVKIKYQNTGEAAVVILNDGIIGTTYETEITITDLKPDIENTITLVPLSSNRRGVGVSVTLTQETNANPVAAKTQPEQTTDFTIPKAPNTGRL